MTEIRPRQSPTATWATVKEAAEYLGRSEAWVTVQIEAGSVKAVKLGEVWLVHRVSLYRLAYRLHLQEWKAGH